MKRLTIIIIILVTLATTGYFVIRKYIGSPDLARRLNERLVELVAQKSNGLYQLSIGDLIIDAEKTSAVLKDIRLRPDSSLLEQLKENQLSPAVIYDFRLENLIIKNVDILHFLENKAAKLNVITISGGELIVRSLKKGEKEPVPIDSTREKLVRSVNRSINEISIDSVHINELDITYINLKKQRQELKKLHIDLYAIKIDSAAATDSSRLFFARRIKVSLDSLKLPLAGNRYRLGAGKMVMTAGEENITTIKDVYLHPAGGASLEKEAAATGKQLDVYRLKADNMIVDDFNYTALLEDSMLQAKAVVLKGPHLEVFNDKSQKPVTQSKVGKYPHQLLARLPYTIDITKMVVDNGDITYMEKNEKGDAIGKILFGRLNGSIGPLQFGSRSATVNAGFNALFMNEVPINVKFRFPVSRNGEFSVSANFAPFNVSILNAASVPLGNARLKEGRVGRLQFTVRGNNTSATGTTTLQYEGLKIEVLKADKDKGYKKAGLLSFIANEFVLREDNPPGGKHADTYTTSYRRVTTKSFFNLIWKTVFYGVKANTGVGLKGSDKERATIH